MIESGTNLLGHMVVTVLLLQVCGKVLAALQINDDPMLNYGAATVISFASSANAVSKLSPTDYGKYLRSSEFEPLIENSRFALDGPLTCISDSRCAQTVAVQTFASAQELRYEIQLCKELRKLNNAKDADADADAQAACWLIDSISMAQ